MELERLKIAEREFNSEGIKKHVHVEFEVTTFTKA